MSSHFRIKRVQSDPTPRLILPKWNELNYQLRYKLRKYFAEEAARRDHLNMSNSETTPDHFEESRITHILRQTNLSCFGNRRLISMLYKEWIEVELNPLWEAEKARKQREKTVASTRSGKRKRTEQGEGADEEERRTMETRSVTLRGLKCSGCGRTLMNEKQKNRHQSQCKGPRYKFHCVDCLNTKKNVKDRVFFPSQEALDIHRASKQCSRTDKT